MPSAKACRTGSAAFRSNGREPRPTLEAGRGWPRTHRPRERCNRGPSARPIGRPGGCGNRGLEPEAGALQQPLHQRALADPDAPERTINRPGSSVQSTCCNEKPCLKGSTAAVPDPAFRGLSVASKALKQWKSIHDQDHSTFWINSRIFSRRVLISKTLRLISTSLALDPIVFTSRPIS